MELYRKVRLACRDGMSERAAARHFGVSRESVRKMLAFSVPPGYRRTAPVRRWLRGDRKEDRRKQRHTAKRIFERLRDEHDFTGGEGAKPRRKRHDARSWPVPAALKGTSQIRAEMHGKGRFADARRPFRLPSECPEFLRRRFPTQSRGLRRPVVALSGAVLAGRTPEDTRSPRQAATSDVGHEHGGVTDKPTFSPISLPMWTSSAEITAASRPFLYDLAVSQGLERSLSRASCGRLHSTGLCQ